MTFKSESASARFIGHGSIDHWSAFSYKKPSSTGLKIYIAGLASSANIRFNFTRFFNFWCLQFSSSDSAHFLWKTIYQAITMQNLSVSSHLTAMRLFSKLCWLISAVSGRFRRCFAGRLRFSSNFPVFWRIGWFGRIWWLRRRLWRLRRIGRIWRTGWSWWTGRSWNGWIRNGRTWRTGWIGWTGRNGRFEWTRRVKWRDRWCGTGLGCTRCTGCHWLGSTSACSRHRRPSRIDRMGTKVV